MAMCLITGKWSQAKNEMFDHTAVPEILALDMFFFPFRDMSTLVLSNVSGPLSFLEKMEELEGDNESACARA